MRLTPRAPWKPLYKLQAWYFPIVYSLTAIDFIMRDFMMVLIGKSDANHVYPKMNRRGQVTFLGRQAVLLRDHVRASAAGLPLVAGADRLPDRDADARRLSEHRLPSSRTSAAMPRSRCRWAARRTSTTSGPCTRSRRRLTSRRGKLAAELLHRRAELPDRAPIYCAHLSPELPASRAGRAPDLRGFGIR